MLAVFFEHDDSPAERVLLPEGDMVYVLRGHEPHGLIKIGHAKDGWLSMRVKYWRDRCAPTRLDVVKLIPGGPDSERELHRKFKDLRVTFGRCDPPPWSWGAEWFISGEELLRFLGLPREPTVPRHATDLPPDASPLLFFGMVLWYRRVGYKQEGLWRVDHETDLRRLKVHPAYPRGSWWPS